VLCYCSSTDLIWPLSEYRQFVFAECSQWHLFVQATACHIVVDSLCLFSHSPESIGYRDIVGTGIIPDIEVNPTKESIISGRDVVLEKALKVLKEQIQQ